MSESSCPSCSRGPCTIDVSDPMIRAVSLIENTDTLRFCLTRCSGTKFASYAISYLCDHITITIRMPCVIFNLYHNQMTVQPPPFLTLFD